MEENNTTFNLCRKVSFGMFWQEYGRQTIPLPDQIDPENKDDVRAYIESVWDDIPLPSGDYVSDSDELDTGSVLSVTRETAYRTESFSGSGEREAVGVMAFEMFELMNTDILDTLSAGVLKDHPIKSEIRDMIELIEGWQTGEPSEALPEADSEKALEFCQRLLDAVAEVTGITVRYALWLTTKEQIASYYGKDMDDATDYSAYEIGPVILSDLQNGDILYGYPACPQPLDIRLEPIRVTNDDWAK